MYLLRHRRLSFADSRFAPVEDDNSVERRNETGIVVELVHIAAQVERMAAQD